MMNQSKENAKKLGLNTMLFQTIEECSELQKAICKYNRVNGIGQKTEMSKEEAILNLIDELADVEICMEQLKYLLDLDESVDKRKKDKLNKVTNRYNDR